jgi:Peptidase family C25
MMRVTHFLSVVVLISLADKAKAQSINLNWKDKITYSTPGEGKKEYAKVSNLPATTSLSNGVPTVLYEFPSAKALKIKELVWTIASKDEILDLGETYIPDSPIADIVFRQSNDGTQMVNFIMAGGFKRVNNKIYKLERIDLEPEDTEEASKKARGPMATIGTTDNPLKSGVFYKIKVDKTGIFKITSQFLRDNGINPANINPKQFKIYGNGGTLLPENCNDNRFDALQQAAIEVIGEADGQWDEDDYAIFYGVNAHGYETFNRAGNNIRNMRKGHSDYRLDKPRHVDHLYDDYSYYFICFDEKPALRVQKQTDIYLQTVVAANRIYSSFDNFAFIDHNKVNYNMMGRYWASEPLTGNKTYSFDVENVVMTAPIYYRTRLMATEAAGIKLSFGHGKYTQDLDIDTKDLSYPNFLVDNSEGVMPASSSRLEFPLTIDNSANPNGKVHLDYLEMDYEQYLKFNGTQLSFRRYDVNERRAQNHQFNLTDGNNADRVWDVSNRTVPVKTFNKSTDPTVYSLVYQPTRTTLYNNEFIAFKLNAAYTPTFVGRIDNQDLPKQGIDYLLIAPPEFLSQAQRLADFHSRVNKYKTLVVTPQEIYNQYSSASKDISAIRNYVSELYNTPQKQLKFVTLFGDSSADTKNVTPNNDNKMLSYVSEYGQNLKSSYITDDFFVMVDKSKDIRIESGLPRLAVGRLLASNQEEAKTVVDKILAYNNALPGQSSPFGTWRMNADVFVDDDNIFATRKTFHGFAEYGLKQIFETSPFDKKEYFVSKNYFDAFKDEKTAGGQRYPLVSQKMNNALFNSLYINYMGHGGPFGWAEERAFTLEDVLRSNNINRLFTRLPVMSTITCDFTIWDNPNLKSAGEILYKKGDGGAIAMITSSRALYENYGIGDENPDLKQPPNSVKDMSFSNRVNKFLFKKSPENKFLPVGTQLANAKVDYGNNTEHLKVNYLGDPALVMARPQNNIVIEKVDSPITGQLRAKDVVSVIGYVKKADGSVDANFNGNLSINVYDKLLDKVTLNNDGDLDVIKFKQEPTPVVKSAGKVVNGRFNAQFYVPKDINVDLGKGRMLLYADNSQYDVYQNKTDIKIGGINENALPDNTPPVVKLFMNNNNFVNGGITNKNPIFIACLSDDTGINASGSGIGHDISFMLDGQVVNTIVLNEYYTAGENKLCPPGNYKPYQLGSVGFPLYNIKPGPHQITLKVWDLNNNSTTETLDFIVKDTGDQNLAINKPLNWPNPFTQKTYFQFEHNCDDVLDVNVQVYTISGKLVKNIRQFVSSETYVEGFRTPQRAIEWDGTDDFGDALAKGTYVYKLTVASTNASKCPGTATAIEKLVILK